MAAKDLIEFRNLLAAKAPALAGEGLSTRSIAYAFLDGHTKEVSRVSRELIVNALVEMIAALGNRRSKPKTSSGQLDLLSRFGLPTTVSIIGDDGLQKRISVHKLKRTQAEAWIRDHKKTHRRNLAEVQKFRECLDALRPYMDEETTLEEAAKKAADASLPDLKVA